MAVNSTSFSEDGRLLLAGTTDGSIRLYGNHDNQMPCRCLMVPYCVNNYCNTLTTMNSLYDIICIDDIINVGRMCNI